MKSFLIVFLLKLVDNICNIDIILDCYLLLPEISKSEKLLRLKKVVTFVSTRLFSNLFTN